MTKVHARAKQGQAGSIKCKYKWVKRNWVAARHCCCGRDGRRKMQVGVCGRALGVGMTLEHPVGPDRRKQLGAEVQISPDRCN